MKPAAGVDAAAVCWSLSGTSRFILSGLLTSPGFLSD